MMRIVNIDISIKFFVLGLLFGMGYLILTPPFQVPDEQTHFFRAYQVSDGTLLSERQDQRSGGWLPASVYRTVRLSRLFEVRFHPREKVPLETTLSLFEITLSAEEQMFVEFPNTAPYAPLIYLPQGIGILIGKIFDFSPIILMYMGRTANLFVSVLLISLAIRIIPVFKHVLFLVGMMPIALFQMASLSADGLTISLSLFFTAFILYYKFSSAVIQSKDVFFFLVLFVTMALVKTAYIPLLFLFFLIPVSKFKGFGRYIVIFAGLMVVSVVIAGGWALLVQRIYVPEVWNGGNPPEQIRFILSSPAKFTWIIIRDLFLRNYLGYVNAAGKLVFPESYLRQLGVLGWTDTFIPSVLMNFWWTALLAVVLVDEREDVQFTWVDKLKIFVVFSMTVLAILSLVYICCSPPGANFIIGQGRYLLPVLPLFLLLFYNRTISGLFHRKFTNGEQLLQVGLIVISTLVTAATYVVLGVRYYGWWGLYT